MVRIPTGSMGNRFFVFFVFVCLSFFSYFFTFLVREKKRWFVERGEKTRTHLTTLNQVLFLLVLIVVKKDSFLTLFFR